MPLDDLTGTWTDLQHQPRRVWPCPCDDRDDTWHVTSPNFKHVRHYDGNTIREWWTLTLPPPPATPQQAHIWADRIRATWQPTPTETP